MAKVKITELEAITAAQLADGDMIPVVDVSDSTMSSTGTNKRLAKSELAEASGLTAHLGDTTDAHDASAISYTPGGTIGSTDVQAAVAEVASDAAAALAAHVDDTTDAHDASVISVADTGGNYAGTTVEAVLAELPSRYRTQLRDEVLLNHARHVTLISGGNDQSPTSTNSTLSADTTNFTVGSRGQKVTMAGAVTATVIYDPINPSPRADPMIVPPASGIGLSVYLADASKVTSISMEIALDEANTSGLRWSRGSTNWSGTLANGWNHMRWRVSESNFANWATGLWRIRLVIVTNAATELTIGHAWAECRPKASITYINDSCYRTFYELGYPAMQARRWPVTWAPDPAILGTQSAPNDRMTEAQLAAAMASGNGDECSTHGWDGAATELMTADEYRVDVLRALRWLHEKGYHSGAIWKAAVTQNVANNGSAGDPYLWASATYSGSTSDQVMAWPPVNRYNLHRFTMHGKTTAEIDSALARLRLTNGVMLWYSHGIDDSAFNMAPALWAYILDAWDTAVAEGWLEFVTLNELIARDGGRVINAGGRSIVEWVDATGTTQRQALP